MRHGFLILLFLLITFPVNAQHEHHAPTIRQKVQNTDDAVNHRATHSKALYGNYPMTREASGTSWQPDSSRHEGLHFMKDEWVFMVHGFANFVYNDQGGDRGEEETFSSNMLMFMGHRELGGGTFGFRSMLSLDPLQGDDGYAL